MNVFHWCLFFHLSYCFSSLVNKHAHGTLSCYCQQKIALIMCIFDLVDGIYYLMWIMNCFMAYLSSMLLIHLPALYSPPFSLSSSCSQDVQSRSQDETEMHLMEFDIYFLNSSEKFCTARCVTAGSACNERCGFC